MLSVGDLYDSRRRHAAPKGLDGGAYFRDVADLGGSAIIWVCDAALLWNRIDRKGRNWNFSKLPHPQRHRDGNRHVYRARSSRQKLRLRPIEVSPAVCGLKVNQ